MFWWMNIFEYKYTSYVCLKKGDFIVSSHEFIFFTWPSLGVWAIGWGWEIHHWRCGSVDKGGIPECGQEHQDTDVADGHRRQQVKKSSNGGKVVKRWLALTAGKIKPLWIVARWFKSPDVCDTLTLCKKKRWESRGSWWRERKKLKNGWHY